MRSTVGQLLAVLLASSVLAVDGEKVIAQEAAALPADAPGPLVIAGWGGLSNKFAQELFGDPYTAATSKQVQWLPVPGQQVAAIQAQTSAGQVQWDVANALLGDQLAVLSQQGLLWKLPPEIKARLAQKMPDVGDYGIEYATLSDVIACNAKAIASCPKTPQEFFNLKDFPGPRSFYVGGPLVAMAMALQADGVAPDKIFPMDIARAFRKLREIRGNIPVFWQSGDQSEQILRSGEVAVAVLWNGRARNLATHPTDRMTVDVSWQGAVYEPAYTAVVKGAIHPHAAFGYLQWIVDHPDAMAGYAERTTYGFPSLQLFSLVKDDIAKWLPEFPDHFAGEVRLDLNWYLQHKSEIDALWKEYTSAS